MKMHMQIVTFLLTAVVKALDRVVPLAARNLDLLAYPFQSSDVQISHGYHRIGRNNRSCPINESEWLSSVNGSSYLT